MFDLPGTNIPTIAQSFNVSNVQVVQIAILILTCCAEYSRGTAEVADVTKSSGYMYEPQTIFNIDETGPLRFKRFCRIHIEKFKSYSTNLFEKSLEFTNT